MGQCVSRGHPGSYAFARHYDSQSLGSSVFNGGYRHSWGGHSESKGARKRDKSANGNGKPSRGVATSFGFRRRPASSSRADDNARRKQTPHDSNGNGAGSTEDLRPEEVLSGRSTPLARPKKEAAVQQLRTNRFGFRQSTLNKTAKVADLNITAEPAFGAIHKDKETAINNNALSKDKRSTNQYIHQPPSAQVSSTEQTTIVGSNGVPKAVTKQTVILTYQPQQYPVQEPRGRLGGSSIRSTSASRGYGVTPADQKAQGRYTFQTNQLPKPQYPAVKTVDSKSAKQVANNNRKVTGNSEGWREGAGSAVSCDSGVCSETSPNSRRRPRNLEMVMKGSHTFHLRELQVADLDIMDDALITGHAVIPLPKLPSTFDESPDYGVAPVTTYKPPSPILTKTPAASSEHSPMSTLDRYRTRTRPSRIQSTMTDSKEEEKFVFDRAQPESLDKQNSFIKSSSRVTSPPTVCSSKESSPSCKSEDFANSTTDTWQAHAAGEAMANRSQDDASLALSVSSCEEDKPKQEPTAYPVLEVEMPKKIIVISDPPVPHPLLMKSLTLNPNESLRGSMMSSMTSSNYSTTSTCTNQSEPHNLTLTLEETKFDISALETSTQSLLDDETSPADSLISSTSTSDSNNDIQIEREAPSVSSSAYITANTKTKSPEPIIEDDDVDGEMLQFEKLEAMCAEDKSTPPSPGTPTHASGSLSLSDGRDFFDDEIADQPALLFRKNGNKNGDGESNKQSKKSKERIPLSPLVQRNKKNGIKSGVAARTPSLDTLSSLASDDLMMDNDMRQSVTSLQSVDDYIERLDSSLRSGLNSLQSLDERQLRESLSLGVARHWSALLEQNNLLDRQLAAMATRPINDLSASATSLTSIGASLPVRTARLLQRSRAQTPSDAGISDGTASPAPASLLQDVVDIKTLLLQLKRVLQEPGDEHQSLSSETRDPLCMRAESPPGARANGRRPPPAALHPDACAEMRRQILFLQSQLEERDRLVKVLQQQMLRMTDSHDNRTDDTCNVATQTDRLRLPMSTSMTGTETSGLVSWNEQSNLKKQLSSDAQKAKRSITTNGPCTCGASVRATSRVGQSYLQAVSGDSRRYIKRDSSAGDRSLRKTSMYSTRSKSIENFHKQPYLITECDVIRDSPEEMKHHTSYGDLYNGRVSSKESVNRHSPITGQSTDTDCSSDGGYKSLPSSINSSSAPRRASGIPRRADPQRLAEHRPVARFARPSAL